MRPTKPNQEQVRYELYKQFCKRVEVKPMCMSKWKLVNGTIGEFRYSSPIPMCGGYRA